MSEELKPCPFCGDTPRMVPSGEGFEVVCGNKKCEFCGSLPLAAWNRRAPPPEPKRGAEVEKALSYFTKEQEGEYAYYGHVIVAEVRRLSAIREAEKAVIEAAKDVHQDIMLRKVNHETHDRWQTFCVALANLAAESEEKSK